MSRGRAGPGERQDQIGPFADAVPAHRLAEILVVVGHAPVGRDVEHAGDAERRVHRETADCFAAALEIALQHVVREGHGQCRLVRK